MYGSSLGYSSSTLERIARWALDFTFDFAPAEILDIVSYTLCARCTDSSLFLEHSGGCVVCLRALGKFAVVAACPAVRVLHVEGQITMTLPLLLHQPAPSLPVTL